ncbi:hypothetical protein CEXT_193951 [Caerostris extrusa]|uniref:Uncharacterized protein n=1 Tax=Caerostris extrusa TaxID=172846 RepID=A0AAV4UQQ1_CAEEX|nr:hypothetical protein CEXT_193951 [Caerostris extrusa]
MAFLVGTLRKGGRLEGGGSIHKSPRIKVSFFRWMLNCCRDFLRVVSENGIGVFEISTLIRIFVLEASVVRKVRYSRVTHFTPQKIHSTNMQNNKNLKKCLFYIEF